MSDAVLSVASVSDPARSRAAERQRLRQAASAFEAILTRTMLQAMRRAQLEDGLFGQGPGASIYEGLFDERMSERLAEGSPFGIAKMLFEQWQSAAESDEKAREALRALEIERGRSTYESGFSGPFWAQVPGREADPF